MSLLAPGRSPWTWEDLEAIGDDGTGNRYEIVDGSLVVSPPPGSDHDRIAGRLLIQLAKVAPDWAEPSVPMGVTVGTASWRIPDLVVMRRDLPFHPGPLGSGEALLVVEVESPGTRTTDRITKLAEYADAGIPSYWRLMFRDGPPTLLVYELVDGAYTEVARAQGDDEVTVVQPFPVTLRPGDLLR